MYSHHLRDMLNLLASKHLIADDKIDEGMVILKGYWTDRIAVSWSAQDMIDRAKSQFGRRISKKKACEILQDILSHHDCEYGITWDTIDSHL